MYILNIVQRKGSKNSSSSCKLKCLYSKCNKYYSLRNKLLAHMRIHYKIKPFFCSYCTKSFNDKGNLKTHLRIHTGERPFKCNKCKKDFKTQGQLREHIDSHSNIKPFQCPFCLKYYKRKGVLKNHMHIHDKDPDYEKNKIEYNKIINNIKNKNRNSISYSIKRHFTKKSKIHIDKNIKIRINKEGNNSTSNISLISKIITEEHVTKKEERVDGLSSDGNYSQELLETLEKKINQEIIDNMCFIQNKFIGCSSCSSSEELNKETYGIQINFEKKEQSDDFSHSDSFNYFS